MSKASQSKKRGAKPMSYPKPFDIHTIFWSDFEIMSETLVMSTHQPNSFDNLTFWQSSSLALPDTPAQSYSTTLHTAALLASTLLLPASIVQLFTT